jgi:hypothetical protein
MTDNHDVVVKAGFTADQFIWLRDEAENLGLSHSAYLRNLVMQARRNQSLSKLSANDEELKSAISVLNRGGHD